MSLNLNTHLAPRPKPRPKHELPDIVREYFEVVRGNPPAHKIVTRGYLNRLWGEAVDFSKRHQLPNPLHPAEIAALRTVIMKYERR